MGKQFKGVLVHTLHEIHEIWNKINVTGFIQISWITTKTTLSL